jgi:single-stranded DNA-binding protein
MKFKAENEVKLAGNVASVDIKTGQYGPFGSISLAIEDGYRNPNGGDWVERTQFIRVDVDGKFLEKLDDPLNVGDKLAVDAKLVFEQWEQDGAKRSAIKVKVLGLRMHTPKAQFQASPRQSQQQAQGQQQQWQGNQGQGRNDQQQGNRSRGWQSNQGQAPQSNQERPQGGQGGNGGPRTTGTNQRPNQGQHSQGWQGRNFDGGYADRRG